MNEVLAFLRENPVQFVATVGLDGRPKVRPFQFMLEKDGKLYFCTNNQKEVYAQLQRQPWLELCASSAASQWLRISGKAVFSDDWDVKTRIISENELVRSIYHTPDNTAFEVFYLTDAEATLSDFSGNPPIKIRL